MAGAVTRHLSAGGVVATAKDAIADPLAWIGFGLVALAWALSRLSSVRVWRRGTPAEWNASYERFRLALADMTTHLDAYLPAYQYEMLKWGLSSWAEVCMCVGWPDRLRDGEPLSTWVSRVYEKELSAEGRLAVNCARFARDNGKPGEFKKARMAMGNEITLWLSWAKNPKLFRLMDEKIGIEHRMDLVMWAWMQAVNAEMMPSKLEPAGDWSKLPRTWPVLMKPITTVAKLKGKS